jgi:hypothetical protein
MNANRSSLPTAEGDLSVAVSIKEAGPLHAAAFCRSNARPEAVNDRRRGPPNACHVRSPPQGRGDAQSQASRGLRRRT